MDPFWTNDYAIGIRVMRQRLAKTVVHYAGPRFTLREISDVVDRGAAACSA